jgi:hypothetical protein
MKIRFVMDYPGYSVGDIVDASEITDGLAQGFVNLGIAEVLPEEKAEEKPAKKEKGAQE